MAKASGFQSLAQGFSISVKTNLAATFKKLANSMPNKAKDVGKFIPATWNLNLPEECDEWAMTEGNLVHGRIWIHKEYRIHFHTARLEALEYDPAFTLAEDCMMIHVGDFPKEGVEERDPLGIIQHYINKPFLVHGRKCDFRVYFYIPATNPFITFYSPEFYIKCGHNPYNETSLDMFNVVTNTKVMGQLRPGDYSDIVLGRQQFQEYLSQKGFPQNWVASELDRQLKQKLALLSEVLDPSLRPSLPSTGYELFGVDFMLDEKDMNMWLIEVNPSPELVPSRGARQLAVETILPAVVGTQIDLIKFAASGRPRDSLALSDLPSRGPLQLISGLGA
eukprot:TRINITY_DN15100_c1_g1_i2.p1 TRINITY_DN15100_c1_g1~~TRINITY_DN15100_c1_g1_i2.p1  ORF type:complete len:335 (-),score=37.66 TRINITY_DN15100_c1_g1_i2:523-1527(-)